MHTYFIAGHQQNTKQQYKIITNSAYRHVF